MVIEIVAAIEVPLDAEPAEKLAEAERVFERYEDGLPDDSHATVSVQWEDVDSEGNPVVSGVGTGPYTKAFRERVCPVPEFPGIRKEES